MNFKTISAVSVLTLSFSVVAGFASEKQITIKGTLGTTANGSSSFITASDKEYYFNPVSKGGKKIWNVCERDQVCVVTGVIKKDNIVSVSAVEKGK